MLQKGNYIVKCRECGCDIDVELTEKDLFDSDLIAEDSRSMGKEKEYQISKDTECHSCGRCAYDIDIFEYPDGEYNYGVTM